MKKLILVTLLFANSVWASCPQFYPNGKEIVVPDTVELCNSFYVIRYDVANMRNIFSSEILQPTGHTVERKNDFHADTRIPRSSLVIPSAYIRTGYDKGHMVPAGDATTEAQMSETFLMTNMTPQKPTLNRDAWKMLEEQTRKAATANREPIHVLTAAVYETLNRVNNVPIPTGYFKVVYLKASAHVYYADNADHAPVTETTMAVFEKRTGYKLQ